MTMIIQIYEIQKPEDVAPMVELGVNRIGSVVLDGSNWKSETLRQTIQTTRQMGAESSLIPLFSDPEKLLAAMDFYHPDILHLCEDISAKNAAHRLLELQAAVRGRYPSVKIMRSIPIAPPGRSDAVPTLELAKQFEPISDIFLTDTLLLPEAGDPDAQPVNGFVGITGRVCDWHEAARLVQQSRIPVILAGGISPENVAEGIRRVRPAGVDSCTLTNRTDANGFPIRFQKDPEKVQALIEASHAA